MSLVIVRGRGNENFQSCGGKGGTKSGPGYLEYHHQGIVFVPAYFEPKCLCTYSM